MRWLLLVFLAVVAVACGDAHRTPSKPVKSATPKQLHAVAEKPAKSHTAQRLDSLGYENIAERDTSIAIDLMYAPVPTILWDACFMPTCARHICILWQWSAC